MIMKKSLIRGAAFLLNCLYSILKLLPVQKKITYISRQSNTLSVDFSMVIHEMEKRQPEYRNITLIKMIGDSIPEKIGYCFHMIRQLYHVPTSEMVMLDTYCIVVSLLNQRKNLKVIQMWHALGAMKKFGYSILDKGEGTKKSVAEAMRMHRNYTYVFSSSEFCSRFFAEAFNVSMDKMVVMPLPRLDLLADEKYVGDVKRRIKERYPRLGSAGRKTIIYAPTFRKEGGGFEEEELRMAALRLAEAVDYERYDLVMKFHPLSGIRITHEHAIQDTEFATIDFCHAADIVILDYSAVVFEVAMLGKPMFFYTFDYESYMANRDVYIDFKKYVPGEISEDAEELMAMIESDRTDTEKIEQFRDLMISRTRSGTYTGDVADFFEKTLGINSKEKRR